MARTHALGVGNTPIPETDLLTGEPASINPIERNSKSKHPNSRPEDLSCLYFINIINTIFNSFFNFIFRSPSALRFSVSGFNPT